MHSQMLMQMRRAHGWMDKERGQVSSARVIGRQGLVASTHVTVEEVAAEDEVGRVDDTDQKKGLRTEQYPDNEEGLGAIMSRVVSQ